MLPHMPPAPLLSVVIPTRNEAANLPGLVERLSAALAGIQAELCFVDDSDDDTAAQLERLSSASGGAVHCRLRRGAERAGGLSTAVVAGLRMASGTYVCVMDADLQHPPELIPAMLTAATGGAGLVVASRYVRGGSRGGLDGAGRRLVSRAATAVARGLFTEARRSTDPLSGFFLCRRALADGIEFRPVGFKILLELLVLLPREVRVEDVPLRFMPREHGSSKASARQGLLYLRHLRSLFLEVKGSARRWKFALVGLSGLLVFLPLLALLTGPLHLAPLLAVLPAFAVALAWNTTLNRLWTYADLRRRAGGGGLGAYLRGAGVSALLMCSTYALLVEAGRPPVVAGAGAAVVAMLANGALNWPVVRRPPSAWTDVAVNGGVQVALTRLATAVGGDRAYLLPADLPADRRAADGAVPGALLARVVASHRPVLWTEAASHRPQRRTNIEVSSTLVLPVVRGDEVLAVVVCERRATTGFHDAALETATGAVDGLVAVLDELEGSLPGAPARSGPAPPA
jgi:dolichol-phosphate mannosyltransferase